MNKKLKIIIFIIIMIILIMLLLLFNTENLQKIINKNKKMEESEKFSYIIYDNKDENKVQVLIIIKSENGIEYIECPNGENIQANNRTQIGIDYEVVQGQNFIFKVKEKDKEKEEKTVYIDDEYIINTSVQLESIKDQQGYKIFEISNKRQDDGYSELYYKIGTNGDWIEGDGQIPLLDYNVMASNLSNGDGTVTVYAKVVNTVLSNEIIAKLEYNNIDTSNENNTYEAESLIKAIENYNYGSGIASVKIDDETYDLRVYEFKESTNIDITTPFGLASDVATSSTYAKNTVVIKVNGDLTINEGATLTSYNTKYGGTKGMIVYCTGTLTNNGNVTMTAKGAKAEGQNVYLWKNEDNSFEYVPAVGGIGGTGFYVNRGNGTKSGRVGIDGSGRQTRWWWNSVQVERETMTTVEKLGQVHQERPSQGVLDQELMVLIILLQRVVALVMLNQMEVQVLALRRIIISVEEEQEIQVVLVVVALVEVMELVDY